MYFESTTPESVGIESSQVLKFLKTLNESGLAMHSVLLARGNKLFCEAYWAPYTGDDNHRMYSQTKSYVGIAVAQLAAEGKINLDDKIIDYFPDKLPKKVHPYLAAQTIRNMLNMQTCFSGDKWFLEHGGDRVKYYFSLTPTHYPGTTYFYDSTGSFILCALVERVTGKNFLQYMKEKCLSEIGFSSSARILTAPGGHSWGDSALLCTPLDMLSFARLLANGGEWNGKQLIDKSVIKEATNTHVFNKTFGTQLRKQGYGYQIWGTTDGAWAFFGMHGQFTVYHPATDIMFVCTAGYPSEDLGYAEILFRNFFREIVATVGAPTAPTASFNELRRYISELELLTVKGEKTVALADEISGKTYKAEENPMGITEFSITLDENGGKFRYVNKTGEKTIKFGLGSNAMQLFPELGYSKDLGGMPCDGNAYRCAASAGWVDENTLNILVQIIDDYIGILDITIGFRDEYAVIDMKKSAEYFLEEYHGYLTAKL